MNTAEPIAAGTPFRFGENVFTFGREIVELDDSSALLQAGDFVSLRDKMARDGYLFLRGFHPRPLVEAARRKVLSTIAERGGLATDDDLMDGRIGEANQAFAFFRDIEISQSPEVLAVVDGAHSWSFYEKYFGEAVSTFDKRWLRAMAHGGNNHFHYDSAYVGRGTNQRVTMWSAFTDIDLHNGPLVICLNSHRDERLKTTYGAIDMDRDLTDPVFSADAREMVEKFGFTLATAHFQPGDAIVFGLWMMHSSAPNLSDRYRISIDTRYQPSSQPSDERFHGEDGQWLGNFYNKNATYKPMAELRREWGLN